MVSAPRAPREPPAADPPCRLALFLDSLIAFSQSFQQNRELGERWESSVPSRNILSLFAVGFFFLPTIGPGIFEQDKNTIMPAASEAKEIWGFKNVCGGV